MKKVFPPPSSIANEEGGGARFQLQHVNVVSFKKHFYYHLGAPLVAYSAYHFLCHCI